MTTDPLVETLLASETVAAAIEVVRVSRRPPTEVAGALLAHSVEVGEANPATAAAADFLARAISDLEAPRAWLSLDHISGEVNGLLREASLASGWPGALSVLREQRSLLDHDVMSSVAAWHADLANHGVSPHANGTAMVITIGALLGGRSRILAHLIWARGCVATSMPRAEWHFEKARALAVAEGEGDLQAAAEMAMDSLHRHSGGYAQQRAAEPLDDVTPVMVPIYEANAFSLRDSGRYLDALRLLDQSIPVAAEVGLEENLMRMLNVRGLIHDDLSHYTRAEDDFREAARLARQLGDDPRRFEALNNAAASYLKRGQPLRALPAFRAILREADSSGLRGRRIAARNNLALAYANGGDPRSARDLYLQALELLGDDLSSGSFWITVPGLAHAYSDLGDEKSYLEVGQRLWQLWAEEGNENALVTYITSVARDFSNPEVRYLADQVAEALVSHGDLLLAGTLALKLAADDRERGDDRRALERLDAFIEAFADSRSSVAVCIHAELAAAAIENETPRGRTAAIARLRSAVASVEERVRLAEQAIDGDWLLDTARPLYLGLVDALLEDNSPEARVEAFWLHEASRPVTLTGALRPGGGVDRTRGVSAGRVAGIDDVRSALRIEDRRATAVVSFVETETRVGAFVVTSGGEGASWVPLTVTAAELDAAAESLSIAFNGDPTRFPPRAPLAAIKLAAVDLTATEDVLARLGEVLPVVGTPDVVCVVPSSSMEGLPLHAVRDRLGVRLLERAAVVVQPSLSSLVAAAAVPPAVAGPKAVFVAGVAAAEDGHPEFFEDDERVFNGLDVEVTTRLGADATPAAVLEGVRTSDFAQLACHGFVDTHDPLGSGLLLSDGQRRPSRRTQSVPLLERAAFELTVRDLAQESLGLELVALRACSTARRAAVAAKEESSTLTRALQAAGCRTIVSALWNVDQRSSLALFEDFYAAHLGEGFPACEALAIAQRKMLTSGPPYSHLYHWGAFMVSGDWRGSDNER
ncbi:CHAT domain-containing tetratricopeptide repeat protein [Kribbella sp. NBC_01245]|uniref:CHAT domain-containing protein n=1 Tax=Kribbella sp. NBC_01245 TaxID=2903578 RepID=UPI002E29A5EB|nr:CHAT domain-containing tetratricopeptide repeat protein [Kribbella sp. NBC_01245]